MDRPPFDPIRIPAAVIFGFIVLHNVDGTQVLINPKHIVSLHERYLEPKAQVMTKGVNCVVVLVNGKIVGAVETCTTVANKMIDEAK